MTEAVKYPKIALLREELKSASEKLYEKSSLLDKVSAELDLLKKENKSLKEKQSGDQSILKLSSIRTLFNSCGMGNNAIAGWQCLYCFNVGKEFVEFTVTNDLLNSHFSVLGRVSSSKPEWYKGGSHYYSYSGRTFIRGSDYNEEHKDVFKKIFGNPSVTECPLRDNGQFRFLGSRNINNCGANFYYGLSINSANYALYAALAMIMISGIDGKVMSTFTDYSHGSFAKIFDLKAKGLLKSLKDSSVMNSFSKDGYNLKSLSLQKTKGVRNINSGNEIASYSICLNFKDEESNDDFDEGYYDDEEEED